MFFQSRTNISNRNAVAAIPFPPSLGIRHNPIGFPHDELLLHMQQKFVGHESLNVCSCRPASRSTSTRRRHARCPR